MKKRHVLLMLAVLAALQVGVAIMVLLQASLAEEPGFAFAERIMDLGDPAGHR